MHRLTITVSLKSKPKLAVIECAAVLLLTELSTLKPPTARPGSASTEPDLG